MSERVRGSTSERVRVQHERKVFAGYLVSAGERRDGGGQLEDFSGEGWQQQRGRKRRDDRVDPSVTLFAANLPAWPEFTLRSWLLDFFKQWGTVNDVFIPKKKDAFVRMARGSHAEKATVALNGRVLARKKLQVNPATFHRKEFGDLRSVRPKSHSLGMVQYRETPKAGSISGKQVSKSANLKIGVPAESRKNWADVVRNVGSKKIDSPYDDGMAASTSKKMIELMVEAKEEKEIFEWLSNTVVVAPCFPMQRA